MAILFGGKKYWIKEVRFVCRSIPINGAIDVLRGRSKSDSK